MASNRSFEPSKLTTPITRPSKGYIETEIQRAMPFQLIVLISCFLVLDSTGGENSASPHSKPINTPHQTQSSPATTASRPERLEATYRRNQITNMDRDLGCALCMGISYPGSLSSYLQFLLAKNYHLSAFDSKAFLSGATLRGKQAETLDSWQLISAPALPSNSHSIRG